MEAEVAAGTLVETRRATVELATRTSGRSVPLALDQMTVHGWVALARTYLSNARLEVSDVFPVANTQDWDAGSITQVDTAIASEGCTGCGGHGRGGCTGCGGHRAERFRGDGE